MFRYGKKANYLMNEKKSKEYIYFNRIKTKLDPLKLEKDSLNIKIKSKFPGDVEMPLKFVIEQYLKAISDDCLESINRKGHKFTKKDINWVVTVPAIWNDYGKELMKECAIEAGMENIKIALEPEAASLLLFDDASILSNYKKIGKKFILVDAGGYTIDITLNEIVDKYGNLKQLSPPSGNSFGSMIINKDILKLIKQVISKDVLNNIKKNKFEEYYSLLNQIESLKIAANLDESEILDTYDYFIIKLNSNSCGWFSSSRCKKITDFGEIEYDNEKIYIPKQVMKKLILKRISPIITHIKEIYETFKDINIDMLVLTGGYSNSDILKKEMEKNFNDVIILQNPENSVVKGAVIYGINPNKIISRKTPRTIGISVYSRQRQGTECRKPKEVDGETHCEYFDIFKRKGEDIINNEIKEKTYIPLKHDQTLINFILYGSNTYEPTYIDEEGVYTLGSFELEMDDTYLEREERKVLVKMEFGANINVYAKNINTGKEIKIKANYYNSEKI